MPDMSEFHQEMLNTIRMKCLNYDVNHPVKRSSMVAFRDIFDPYCSEYMSIDNNQRVAILRELMGEGIVTSLLVFYKMFMDLFAKDRPDIANAAPDALALLLEHLVCNSNCTKHE